MTSLDGAATIFLSYKRTRDTVSIRTREPCNSTEQSLRPSIVAKPRMGARKRNKAGAWARESAGTDDPTNRGSRD